MTLFDENYCSQTVQCLQFDVRDYSDETDYNVGMIIVGALLAFLLGLLICFIIARTCLRGVLLKKAREISNRKKTEANEKRRVQLERKKRAQLITKDESEASSSIISSTTTDNESSDDQEKIEFDPDLPDDSEEYLEQERANQLEKKLKQEIEEEFTKGTVPSDLRVFLPYDFKQTSSCFAQALIPNDIAQAEKELIVQDAMNLALLLHEARLEKFQAAVQLMRVLLTPLKKQEKITAELGVTVLKQLDKGFEDEWSKRKKELFLRIKQIQIEEKKPDKLKQAIDSVTQEEVLARKRNAIKDAQAEFIAEANKVLDTVINTMQLTLQMHSDLSNEEIEEMVAKFKKYMSHLEQLICDNILIQHTLQQRTLVKRRKVAFVMVAQKTSVNKCNLNKLETMKMIIKTKIDAKDLDSVQGKYDIAALDKVESDLTAENTSFRELAQKFADDRNDKLVALENQLTAQERSEFFGKEAPQLKKAAEFLEAYHKFQVRQREERSKLNEVLDHEEAQEIEKLLPKHSSDVTTVEETFVDKLVEGNLIAQNDVSYILKSFENQQKKFIEKQQKKLEEFKAALSKEHVSLKQKMSEDRNSLLSELKMVQDMLETTLNKLLKSQDTLDEKSTEIIQSEFKMMTLKLKTTLLSQKLIQRNVCKQNCVDRKARLAEYKQKQQMEFLHYPPTHRGSKMKAQDEMIGVEEKRVDLLNKKEELNSRGYSAQQTESAIRQLESEMSSVIGRITAECARRQLILNRQSRAIDELQKNLLGQLSENSPTEISRDDVQKIMNEHKMNLEHLKMTHSSDREQQRVLLESKIQAKKQVKEQQVKQQVLSDTKRMVKENAITDSEMKKLIFYQKEQDSLNRIEREMSEEQKMQWKVLERKLNKELEEKLEENRKEFIVKMAVMGNLGDDTVIQLVYNAIIESGIDGNKAKSLMKDIKKRLEKSRSEVEQDRRNRTRKSFIRSSDSEGSRT